MCGLESEVEMNYELCNPGENNVVEVCFIILSSQ